ncbi:hypothetical protein [Intrasporangium sp.]|uniref:hypothetical protein n=1 Tax=Intrasporangium sp. TaxID=1925024 RepID=UPI00293A6F00|nr:hypothetical protein [Intrasporangium sp.]MDV3222830.1 hypothetical protein [Intrasporangium sp.]
MGIFDRGRRGGLPDDVRRAVPMTSGDRIIAWAKDEQTGGHVVASTHHLAFVGPDSSLAWQRPWHEAEAGTWQGDSQLLTVTWVDQGRPAQWLVRDASLFKQALRERIQASVVLSDEFRTESRRTVRVVIRQDFANGTLLEQVVPGKGVDLDDPAVAAEASTRLARLRSEVGL